MIVSRGNTEMMQDYILSCPISGSYILKMVHNSFSQLVEKREWPTERWFVGKNGQYCTLCNNDKSHFRYMQENITRAFNLVVGFTC